MIETAARQAAPKRLWVDLTRKCQLECGHCLNESGPSGDHGSMTARDWRKVLEQAAGLGVGGVQFFGGEPMLHPDGAELLGYALDLGLQAEVYSNLVHVPQVWWAALRRPGASLATSYYSDQAEAHDAVTGRRSHRRTRANIVKAVRLGIELRVGIVTDGDPGPARRDLESVGVTRIQVDRVRPFGRAAAGREPQVSQLCGACGEGKAAVDPWGRVSPCVFSRWMGVGDVRERSLADILGGAEMAEAVAAIRAVPRAGVCDPDEECTPGTPSSGCTPKK